ncbi:hypothetical protein HY570_00890 [Candidatus Micrarchaeota archaeon]|nr:hypothetical protein [Candidatus Micrarchaeota archaeon]
MQLNALVVLPILLLLSFSSSLQSGEGLCPPGYVSDFFGNCYSVEIFNESDFGFTCPPGYYLGVDGFCYPIQATVCPEGYYLGFDGNCYAYETQLICPEDYILIGEFCYPIESFFECPPGYEFDENNYLCVPTGGFECPAGYEYDSYYGLCIPTVEVTDVSCPSGYIYDYYFGVCIPTEITYSCPEGYVYDSSIGLCMPVSSEVKECPEGYVYNDLTRICEPKQDCPVGTGYNEISGQCEKVEQETCEPACTAGQSCVNGVCQDVKLTVAYIPVNWQGTTGSFERAVEEQASFFIKSIPLSACVGKVKTVKIPDNCVFNQAFDCIDLDTIKKCADRSGITYDFLVGLRDNAACPGCVGFSCQQGVVYSEHTYPETIATVAHELGHEFGLVDEYCYNPKIPPNPTTPELCNFQTACIPVTPGEQIYEYCRQYNDPPALCECNMNDFGGISIMGSAGPNRNAFDRLALDHLKKDPRLQCG